MPSIPPAVAPAFEAVLRAVALIPGFALIPVEVTGPDLGRALAAWLGARGEPVRVVEPRDEPAWRGVVASLLEEGAPGERVMIIGPRLLAPGMAAGLSLVNQRRDMIVEGLGCPLLWCGPAEFLSATWERAPDFWSIRGMTSRVEVRSQAPAESPLWPGVVVRDTPERLREAVESAREHGDAALAARGSVQLAEVLLASGEYAEAGEVIERAREEADGEAAATLALLAARAAYAVGDEARAGEALGDAEERARRDRPSLGPLVTAARGNLAVRDDAAFAVRAYEAALAATTASGDRRNEAVVRADLGVAELALGEATKALGDLETARGALREVGDERGEARALLHIGRAHAALFDARTAAECLEEALEMMRAQGDLRGEARVLCHLARAYLDAGDAEKAGEDARRAVEIARGCGDARLVERAEAVLRMRSLS